MTTNKLKVAVGLSGGVDSSVAALMLVKSGFETTGVHMRCWDYNTPGCRGLEDRAYAIKIASLLETKFVELNFEKEYKETVLSYFFRELKSGRTPNPDVMCNKEIKFGLFLKWAIENGFDYIATGHYARIITAGDRYKLLSGKDESKDQSYFLYRLTQNELKRTIFPIGDFKKEVVRQIAKEQNFPNHDKKDSMGICFIGDINVNDFIKKNLAIKAGNVVDIKGEVIGTHAGIELYTIGQRHGFKMTKYSGLPMYIVDKDPKTNTLIVGFGKDSQINEFYIEDLSVISEPVMEEKNYSVRIRNLGEKTRCKIQKVGQKNKVILEEYTTGVAKGQSAVFYFEEEVIGGGIITKP